MRGRRAAADDASLLIPLERDAGGGQRLSMFTTLTTFGTPLDVTLADWPSNCSIRPTPQVPDCSAAVSSLDCCA